MLECPLLGKVGFISNKAQLPVNKASFRSIGTDSAQLGADSAPRQPNSRVELDSVSSVQAWDAVEPAHALRAAPASQLDQLILDLAGAYDPIRKPT